MMRHLEKSYFSASKVYCVVIFGTHQRVWSFSITANKIVISPVLQGVQRRLKRKNTLSSRLKFDRTLFMMRCLKRVISLQTKSTALLFSARTSACYFRRHDKHKIGMVDVVMLHSNLLAKELLYTINKFLFGPWLHSGFQVELKLVHKSSIGLRSGLSGGVPHQFLQFSSKKAQENWNVCEDRVKFTALLENSNDYRMSKISRSENSNDYKRNFA